MPDADFMTNQCISIPLPDLTTKLKLTNFNVYSHNIHSLNAHHDELVTTLAALPVGFFNVLALQEIWSINSSFVISGYHSLVYNSRDMDSTLNPNCGGGVGLYIKNNLNYEILHNLSHFEKGVYESIWIKIIINKKDYLLLGNIYRPNTPPLGNSIRATQIHASILDKIKLDKSLRKGKIIICSDFNLDIANVDNINSNNYLDLHFQHGLIPLITLSAHTTTTSARVIDHIFVKQPPTDAFSGVLQIQISDHLPTIYSDPTILTSDVEAPLARPLVNKVTIASYLKLLKKVTFLFNGEPEHDFNHFFELVTAAGDLAFPLTSPKSNKRKNRNQPWITKGILVSIRRKHSLFNLKLNFPTLTNTNNFRTYNRILNKCKRKAKQLFYCNAFDDAKFNLRETWRLIGEISGREKNKTSLNSKFKINGVTSSDKNLIANEFNRFFGEIGPKLASEIPQMADPNNNFHKFLGIPTKGRFSLNPITSHTLLRHITDIKPKSSSGRDQISNKILKLATPSLLLPLTELINLSLATGYVPSQVTLAKVVPLHKEGEKDLFNNYRPIAIVSSIGKLLERIVAEQLNNYIESWELMSIHQYGFRKGHGVGHPLLHFTTKILNSLNKGFFNLSVFIDLKKAFDTVDFQILLDKLAHYGILGKELRWFSNYLKRTQQVFTGTTLSDIFFMLCGIPQGTVLGPILFILFINDLPACLDLFCQLFADDTTLQIEGKTITELLMRTKEQLTIAQNWFNVNKLTLNLKKTKFVIFTSDQHEIISVPPLTLGQATLDRVGINQPETSVRFLGLWMDGMPNFIDHLLKLKSKVNTGLYFLTKAKDNSPVRIRLSIYRSLIESQLRYAAIIYGSAPAPKIEEIFKLQKRAMRLIDNLFFRAHTEPIFLKYKILKLQDLISLLRASIIHQFRNGKLPPSFDRQFFKFINESESTRRNDPLYVRLPELTNPSLSRNPYMMICNDWNNVPYFIKIIPQFSLFKRALTEHYLSKYTFTCTEPNCVACNGF